MTQPRIAFNDDLKMVRDSLVAMTATASEAIRAATTALLDQDPEAVRMTAALEQNLEDDWLAIERRTFQLLARQQPVAGDLRILVSAIKIGADCRRMGALAHHIGTVAARARPAPAIPDELSEIFRRMGDVASRIADGARVTLATSDALTRLALRSTTTPWTACAARCSGHWRDDWSHGVETAVNVALLGRYYERFADHAVAIAQSVIFIVTGARADDEPHPVC